MKIYNVMQYGAKGDGKTNDAFSIQHAIDDCAKNGGGQVVLPSGYTFYSDSIGLKRMLIFIFKRAQLLKPQVILTDISGLISLLTTLKLLLLVTL